MLTYKNLFSFWNIPLSSGNKRRQTYAISCFKISLPGPNGQRDMYYWPGKVVKADNFSSERKIVKCGVP